MTTTQSDHPSPYVTGVTGACPRCGKGKMFSGLLAVAPKCEVCGLDFSFADAGDAPAIFVMTVAGFIVLGLALTIEILYQPPYWVHAAVSVPLAAILCLVLLRPTKGLMIAMQYATKAEEGRIQE
jgi:uncharacterized protein (DUF983 family)